jgi:hypothetical protein
MKKFVINISYSWGYEEEPIKMNVTDKWIAFGHMCSLVIKELGIEYEEHPEYTENTMVKVFEDKIILHYGHDDEECYYELKEI